MRTTKDRINNMMNNHDRGLCLGVILGLLLGAFVSICVYEFHSYSKSRVPVGEVKHGWTITERLDLYRVNAFVMTDPHGQKFLVVNHSVIPYSEPKVVEAEK